MSKKIIIWTTNIDNLLLGDESKMIGGITVQMYMWAKVFRTNGWKVYTFTENKKNRDHIKEGINFLYCPSLRYINPILSLIFSILTIFKLYPKCILHRGATRDLLFISIMSRILGIKLIQFFASDTDLDIGNELIESTFDKKCYRLGVQIANQFIVQNDKQAQYLKKYYNKPNYLKIPNIWHPSIHITNPEKRSLILWVSNFRELKRPEWLLYLAKELQNEKFVMIGGAIDQSLFTKCKNDCSTILNMEFLGSQSFMRTNDYFNQAYVFICTSEIEGFPNTFLQAWSNQIPVISTFDPSNLIQTEKLGIYCKSIEELKFAIEDLKDPVKYKTIQNNIRGYFYNNHLSENHYIKLINQFCII